MAQRIHRVEITSPHGNGPINSTLERTDFPPGVVEAITVEIPSGHVGKTGIRIWYNDAQLIPRNASTWLKGNKKTIRYDFDDPHPGGVGWYVDHYNAGRRDHTFYFVVELSELADALLNPPVLLLRQYGETYAGEGGAGTVTPVGGGASGGSGVATE